MFLQQSPKKERTKSATLSAPPNMLAFRSPQAVQQQAAATSTSSSVNGPSTSNNNTSSNTATNNNNTANASSSTSDSSTLFLPSMDHQQFPQKFPSLATPQAKPEPTTTKPESPKKKSTSGPRQLTPSAIQQQHHSQSHSSSSNDNANTSLGSLPTSAYLPGPLPGVSTSLADLPGGKSSSSAASSNRQPKIPQSKRAPQDPYNAPGVSFRSSLRPPASAQIPDIPYGEGMVPRPKRQRALSGASSSVATSNGTATTGVGSGVKARIFTPSDAHTNIRVGEDTPTNRQGANYTARNTAGGQPVHQIVASSPASAQARASAIPKGTLVTPSAPLTVNAPVVPAKETLITSLDPQHIENFKQSTPQQAATASPSKQPVKSALKAKSWADLVRPMSNVHIAQEAVKNVGFTQDQVNNSGKKRVSIALPSRASDATSNDSTPTGSRAGTPSNNIVTTRVPTHSSIPTAEGNDKSPHHRSPPPERVLDEAIQAGENGDAAGDIARSASPGRAPSVHSNFTAASGGSNHSVLNNMMAKQRSLDDLLAGVETSQSRVTLYPRGLVNTGNACFMNSILQTLLFTAPFYNLISLIGAYTSEDLSGRTPLLDAMVSYLSEFKTSNPERESQLGRGESYEEQLQKNDAFIPSIIYHALNNNARFAQMGFSTGSASASGINHSYTSSSAPLTKANLAMNTNHLSQEDAQEFLGFFLDTIHEELLIKTEAWDKQRWEKANRGIRAGMDSLARQSVNSIDEYENSLLANQAQAPHGASNPASVMAQSNGVGADSSSMNAAAEDDEWLEVGQKGRTATTRTTQTQESAVTRIFGGKLRSVLRCPGQKDSVTLEPFMSLQLEIQSPQIQTVTDALESIAEPETLHDVTNKQNLKVEATKQVFIESLPPILILHLKRFIYDSRAGVSKSHKIISYDTELEIPKECIAPARRAHIDKRRYRLTGVVFHHGKTASGGHYSVCCRQNNGRWVNIDDTTISPITAEDAALDRDRENLRLSLPSASLLYGVPEKSAYLLFYQRI